MSPRRPTTGRSRVSGSPAPTAMRRSGQPRTVGSTVAPDIRPELAGDRIAALGGQLRRRAGHRQVTVSAGAGGAGRAPAGHGWLEARETPSPAPARSATGGGMPVDEQPAITRTRGRRARRRRHRDSSVGGPSGLRATRGARRDRHADGRARIAAEALIGAASRTPRGDRRCAYSRMLATYVPAVAEEASVARLVQVDEPIGPPLETDRLLADRVRAQPAVVGIRGHLQEAVKSTSAPYGIDVSSDAEGQSTVARVEAA